MTTRLLAFVLAGCVGAVAQPGAAGRVVTLRMSEGRVVTGLLMAAGMRSAPAVVLVPMLGRPRDDWQEIAQRLAAADIHALAVDLPSATLPPDTAELSGWHDVVTAAVAFLRGGADDVRAEAVGVAGASLGASLAVMAAARDPAIRAIALVSPSLEYRGLRLEPPFAAYGARPALLLASVHDPYAARTVRALARGDAPGREVQWSTVPAHGTRLLSGDGAMAGALVEWFQRVLG